jgi:hypothetical protein
MRSSRAVTILALVLTITFVLPIVCLAVPSRTPVTMSIPEGCHGNQSPIPAPTTHNCCYATHQAPLAVQTGPSPIAVNVLAIRSTTFDSVTFQTEMSLPVRPEASPPLLAVLRI